ncbi:MAG: glycosyltransferase family 4 protein [Gemmatimonadota bacterium]|nr:glycosyltransferase family 4 protein [Gemmatimonadota bacterium]
MTRRSILHIATERGWRGGERQALWLADWVQRMGHRCILAARPHEPLWERAGSAGLERLAIAPRSEVDLGAVLLLRRAIAREGVQIVHAHTAHAVALGALATLGTPARLVVTRRVDFRLRANRGSRWKYGRARALIAVSHAVARVLEAAGVPPQRIHVVPDGVDLTRRIQPASPHTLGTLGVAAGRPLVVQVAALVPHKDPLTFVRGIAVAREMVPGLQALMLGTGALDSLVREEIAQLELGGVVHLGGHRDDVDALMSAADVVTLSSKEEGMGSVLLDAAAFGKPVAATIAGGIPEVVRDGETGLLVGTHDPDALGRAIARLLFDGALATRLGGAARRHVEEFSMERCAARNVDVYERVLAEDGAVR